MLQSQCGSAAQVPCREESCGLGPAVGSGSASAGAPPAPQDLLQVSMFGPETTHLSHSQLKTSYC